MKLSIAFVLLFSPFLGFSQLDLKEIMTGQDYIGHWPENQFWSNDGSNIYFDWKTGSNRGALMHAYNVKTKLINQLDSIEDTKAITNDLNQADYKVLYFERDNALASLDKVNGDISLCYQSFENISNIQRVVDPNVVILQQGINLRIRSSRKSGEKNKEIIIFLLNLSRYIWVLEMFQRYKLIHPKSMLLLL